MANSDYTARNQTFGFCPYALLAAPIAPLQDTVVITGLRSPFPNGIRAGRAAMIGSGITAEIVVVEAFSGNNLTLGRGCCDTVPRAHAANTVIWFFDDSIARDVEEYTATETIGLKVLPRTLSGGVVPIPESPARPLVFNSRFARPYPPGDVRINGNPFTATHTLGEASSPLVLTWKHRDRITQADSLIKHETTDIGPEAGTTYLVEVLNSSGSVVRTEPVASGTSWSYSAAAAQADLGGTTGTGSIRLWSVRDTLLSWQAYVIPFTLVQSMSRDRALTWNILNAPPTTAVFRDRALTWNILNAVAAEIEGFAGGLTNTGTIGGTYAVSDDPDNLSTVNIVGGQLRAFSRYDDSNISSISDANTCGVIFGPRPAPALPTNHPWTFYATVRLNAIGFNAASIANTFLSLELVPVSGAGGNIRIEKLQGSTLTRLLCFNIPSPFILLDAVPLNTTFEIIVTTRVVPSRQRLVYVNGVLRATVDLESAPNETQPLTREMYFLTSYGEATGFTRMVQAEGYFSNVSLVQGFTYNP